MMSTSDGALKAGILKEDGRIIHPVPGTPQGGVISAVLANIYLHYALDLWCDKVVRPRCRGHAMVFKWLNRVDNYQIWERKDN